MSARAELEELAKWISDLPAADPTPTPQPATHEDWLAVQGALDAASKAFAQARNGLKKETVLAQLAGDLEREAEAQALRAQLLSRRAPPKPPGEPKRPIGKSADGGQTPTKSFEDLVGLAADSVEKARGKLETVKVPDDATKAFEEDLDLLAEMTLSLRQQCRLRAYELTEAKS